MMILSGYRAIGHSDTMILVWMRRDLRFDDNAALAEAQRIQKGTGVPIQPVFFFDPSILKRLSDVEDRRVEFLHHVLADIELKLEGIGCGLVCRYEDPVEGFEKLLLELREAGTPVQALVCARDYEFYARSRDQKVRALCERLGVEFRDVKDHVFFEASEVRKDDGGPYTVFTPYMRKWRKVLDATGSVVHFETVKGQAFAKKSRIHRGIPSLEEMGFRQSGFSFPQTKIDNAVLVQYADRRNFPADQGTTRLGLHLRFGTVSIRRLVRAALELKADTWLNELIWRDFFSQILQSFPHVETNCFRPEFDRIQWDQNEEAFERWATGQTGVPIVDAGMRELIQTGFMHNRVRMIAGSYLVKNLLIDWRKGESVFARYLLDFDLASNNGNWQWVAGSGCDASPYFRIFNPELQAKKFDPKLKYVNRFVPEWQTDSYPKPLISQAEARVRTLRAYSVVREK